MASAIRALRRLQIGKEAVRGTGLAATVKIPGDITYTEEIDKYFANYPRGVRAPVTKGGVAVRNGAMVRIEQDLSFEDALLIFYAGLNGAPTKAGIGPFEYTFDPGLAVIEAVDSLTVEYAEGDGAADHVAGEFNFGFVPRFSFNWAFNEIATCSWEIVGRKPTDGAVTGALSEHVGREEIPSNLFTVDMDDTWAGLGGTQLTSVVRSGTLEIETGLTPKATIDGRTTLDMIGINSGEMTGRLSLVVELDAVWETERAHWRANDLRFIRLSAISGTKLFRVDLACKYTSPPAFTDSGDGHTLMTMEAELEYDPTGTMALETKVDIDTEIYA